MTILFQMKSKIMSYHIWSRYKTYMLSYICTLYTCRRLISLTLSNSQTYIVISDQRGYNIMFTFVPMYWRIQLDVHSLMMYYVLCHTLHNRGRRTTFDLRQVGRHQTAQCCRGSRSTHLHG